MKTVFEKICFWVSIFCCVVMACVLFFSVVYAEELPMYDGIIGAEIQGSNITFDDANRLEIYTEGTPVMEISMDGTVKINGKLMEKMDTPEIRDAMVSIAESLGSNQARCGYLERQTDYLLERLGVYQELYGQLPTFEANQ